MRLQAEQAADNLVAPDGTEAIIVENNPKAVTFYVPSGPHKGYYYRDKQTGKNTIVAG